MHRRDPDLCGLPLGFFFFFASVTVYYGIQHTYVHDVRFAGSWSQRVGACRPCVSLVLFLFFSNSWNANRRNVVKVP